MKLFLNGVLVESGAARIDPTDRGLTLGDGLYETIRADGGRPWRLPSHRARLTAGAAALGIPLPPYDIGDALAALLAAEAVDRAVFRLTLTRGPAPRGLAPPAMVNPTLLITMHPPAPPAKAATAIIAQGTRRNEHSPTSRLKTLNSLDNILAKGEASARRADDALLLNTAGQLSESSVANLFLVIDGQCLTPPERDGVLPGIVRAALLQRSLARVQSLTTADLGRASEAFLSNVNGIRPLIAVDGQPIGDGRPGPQTLFCQDRIAADAQEC